MSNRLGPAVVIATIAMAPAAFELVRVTSIAVVAQGVAAPLETTIRPRVPIGYGPQADGPHLLLRSPKVDGPGLRVHVTNRGRNEVVAMSFAALVERLPRTEPVTVLRSRELAFGLPPGESIELGYTWLTTKEIDNVLVAASGQPQIFLTPALVRYADGSEWRVEIDRTAKDVVSAMKQRRADLPRTLISIAPGPESAARSLCLDDAGKGFSPGATLPVQGEAAQALCQNGRWVEADK